MRILTLLLLAALCLPAVAQTALEEGSRLAELPAPHTLSGLSGPNGLVLVVFRSADW
jgi:hypothetical protein